MVSRTNALVDEGMASGFCPVCDALSGLQQGDETIDLAQISADLGHRAPIQIEVADIGAVFGPVGLFLEHDLVDQPERWVWAFR